MKIGDAVFHKLFDRGRILQSQEKDDLPQKPAGNIRRSMLKLLVGLVAGGSVATIAQSTNTRPKTLPVLETRIAGFAYYQGRECLPHIKPGDKLYLHREADNLHDQKAIEVFWNNRKMGYVPRSHNAALSKLMDSGAQITAQVQEVKHEQQWEPLEFEVEAWV